MKQILFYLLKTFKSKFKMTHDIHTVFQVENNGLFYITISLHTVLIFILFILIYTILQYYKECPCVFTCAHMQEDLLEFLVIGYALQHVSKLLFTAHVPIYILLALDYFLPTFDNVQIIALIWANLMGMKWYFVVVLICTTLITSEAEEVFIHFWPI